MWYVNFIIKALISTLFHKSKVFFPTNYLLGLHVFCEHNQTATAVMFSALVVFGLRALLQLTILCSAMPALTMSVITF